jgi:hypothetical protein
LILTTEEGKKKRSAHNHHFLFSPNMAQLETHGKYKRILHVTPPLELTYVGRVRLESIPNDARANQAWITLLDRDTYVLLCTQITELGRQLVASESYRRYGLTSLAVNGPDTTFAVQSNDTWKCMDEALITVSPGAGIAAAISNVFPPHIALTLAASGSVNITATIVIRSEWVDIHTSKAQHDVATGDTKKGKLLTTCVSIEIQ